MRASNRVIPPSENAKLYLVLRDKSERVRRRPLCSMRASLLHRCDIKHTFRHRQRGDIAALSTLDKRTSSNNYNLTNCDIAATDSISVCSRHDIIQSPPHAHHACSSNNYCTTLCVSMNSWMIDAHMRGSTQTHNSLKKLPGISVEKTMQTEL